MELYSRMFNMFEESKLMDKKVINRRNFLRGMAGAIALSSQGSLGSSGYNGIPLNYQYDTGFQEKLDDLYGKDRPEFDEDQPNVLLDVIEVGDNYIQGELIEEVESIHDENGVNAAIGVRQESYPEDVFAEKYGGNVSKILGAYGYSGFVKNEVSQEMRDSAIQLIMTPGIREGDNEGWLECPEKEMCRAGFAERSVVALGSDTAFEEKYNWIEENKPDIDLEENYDFVDIKKLTLMHEKGHTYGLEHSDDPSEVMHEDPAYYAGPGYRPDEWDYIRRKLSS